ncbi:MAG: stage II sporulation protein R [Bacillota bacterium]|nr:stage II sporulation protein R [Bacillota bacterium]
MKKISDEKKCVICLALVIIMGLLLFYTYAGGSGENDHQGIIRLHVIANSNTVGDQALKLKVRDAVIEYMEKQDDLESVAETREYLRDNTDRFEKIAEGIIAAQGYDYPAGVSMGVRYIPEKTYGDITFPAGNYEALNITLGDGEGENWWCVLFPPLCLLEEGTRSEDQASSQTLSAEELEALLEALPAEDLEALGIEELSAFDTGELTEEKLAEKSEKSDALTKDQRLKLRWKVLELLRE